MKIIQYIVVLIFAVAITGCFLFPDTTPPEPGNDGTIITQKLSVTEVQVSWTAAVDNRSDTADLEYRVYYTIEGTLDSIEAVEQHGTAFGTWTTSTTEDVTGLEPGNTYILTVLVRDESENMALYNSASITLRADAISFTAEKQYYHLTSAANEFSLTIDLGSEEKDVYFIFSNTEAAETDLPEVTSSRFSKKIETGSVKSTQFQPQPAALRGNPEITEFNASPPPFGDKQTKSILPKAISDSVGEKKTFYDWDGSNKTAIPSTCVSVVSADTIYGDKTLSIWVADDYWDGSESPRVTQTMVDAMAGKFLQAGLENDIYDWVTAIFGEEWGPHDEANLIPENDNITILLYDISNDYAPDQGGIVGFFWAKDNYFRSAADSGSITSSNERIMFYIDAPLYATVRQDEGDWDITDDWPQEIISTLAHEFHHMIHFYQKAVLQTGSSGGEAWLQEMLSMATEDLLSDKLQVTGPRGVDYTDGTAGSPGITRGRLPLYNYLNDTPMLSWPGYTSDVVLSYYSLNYAFGAYLTRNFGGAKLMGDIVQNEHIDEQALITALSKNGYDYTFPDLMTRWTAANLLSDQTGLDEGYRYNRGDWFQSKSNGITYNLGSINLYNYTYAPDDYIGPWLYEDNPVGSTYFEKHHGYGNLFYKAVEAVTGEYTWDISTGSNVIVTVVIK